MKPERLIYTFVSYAAYYDTSWGRGTAMEGIERTAELAHRYGVPVTWIVNAGSVPVLAGRIRAWHETYGDDVILQTPFFVEDAGMSKEKWKRAVERDWNVVAEAFPWAATKVAGRGKIYNETIEALEELGFEGMWGYCWEQVWWDGITHKGIPWGSWYVDGRRFKAPHRGEGRIVAFEWTARDLHAALHSRSPVIYSTDPDDVYRAGLCTSKNIDYWKHVFHDYLANTDHNEQVFFLQQQEGHEMEHSDRFAVFSPEQVEANAGMLDRFFAYITQFPITLTTVPNAAALYKKRNRVTAPSYMLVRDSGVRPDINAYTMALGGAGFGPWPDTFLYYDRDCQMAFVYGECKPHLLRSYVGQGNMDDEFALDSPQVFVTQYEKSACRIELTYEIGHWRPMPFGLVYWDDLAGFEASSPTAGVELKTIKGELAFLRFDLRGEPTTVKLVLERRDV